MLVFQSPTVTCAVFQYFSFPVSRPRVKSIKWKIWQHPKMPPCGLLSIIRGVHQVVFQPPKPEVILQVTAEQSRFWLFWEIHELTIQGTDSGLLDHIITVMWVGGFFFRSRYGIQKLPYLSEFLSIHGVTTSCGSEELPARQL
jgi:hypothetical protein